MFVQIASLCLCNQKGVALYLTFPITTLCELGASRVGVQLTVLSAQHTLGKATTLH